MSSLSILQRKLSYEGCRLVGRQLEQHVKQYNADAGNPKLSSDVSAEIEAVSAVSKELDSLSADPTDMRDVDRGTDSFVAAYHDSLDAQERSFNHAHLIPLTDDEKKRQETTQRVRHTLFPSGTSFIKKSNHLEWSALQDIKNQIIDPKSGSPLAEMNADLEALGMGPQTERLLRWIQKYGEAIGADAIVAERNKKVNEATAAFLSAWEDFAIETRSAMKKTQEPKLKETYALFLGVYDEQAKKELEIEQRYRKAAEKKASETTQTQKTPVEDQKEKEKS